MFIIDYIWIQNTKQCKLQSQINIVEVPDTDELTNDNIQQIPLLKLKEIILKPVYIVKNPFTTNKNNSYLAICEQFTENSKSNNRLQCEFTLTKHYDGKYYFDLTQEFIIDDQKMKLLKMDTTSLSVGDYFSTHREFIDKFLHIMLDLNLPITTLYSTNLNNWEYKICNTLGTQTADIVWLSRYILYRLSESYTFMIKFRNLTITIDDINNVTQSETDPYLTISVTISTINRVKTESEIERIKQSDKKDIMKEQLLLKESILNESMALHSQLEEKYTIQDLEQRELQELEKLNRLKEHQQHISQLRYEARLIEDERIAREERVKIELLKRQEQQDKEKLLILQEQDEVRRMEENKRIQDAELERLHILKEEISVKKSKKMLHTELSNILKEKEEMNVRLKQLAEDEKRDKEQMRTTLMEQREKDELEKLEKLMDKEYQKSKQLNPE